MSRCLMKFLGHLSTFCNYTVLTSSSGFFRFRYWGDNFDPVVLKGNAQSVIFNRTFYHSEVSPLFSSIHLLPISLPGFKERHLRQLQKCSPRIRHNLVSFCDQVLDPHQQKLSGIDALGKEILYKKTSNRQNPRFPGEQEEMQQLRLILHGRKGIRTWYIAATIQLTITQRTPGRRLHKHVRLLLLRYTPLLHQSPLQ